MTSIIKSNTIKLNFENHKLKKDKENFFKKIDILYSDIKKIRNDQNELINENIEHNKTIFSMLKDCASASTFIEKEWIAYSSKIEFSKSDIDTFKSLLNSKVENSEFNDDESDVSSWSKQVDDVLTSIGFRIEEAAKDDDELLSMILNLNALNVASLKETKKTKVSKKK